MNDKLVENQSGEKNSCHWSQVSYTIGLISSVWMITFVSNKTQANFLANVCFSLFPIPQLFTIWDFDIIYAN